MIIGPFKRIVSHAGITLAMQELIYGFIMALIFVSAARIGILEIDSKEHLLILIIGMNLTWGAIDAIVFYIMGILDQKKHAMILTDDGMSRDKRREMLMDELQGTAVDMLSDEDAMTICDRMLDMEVQNRKSLADDRKTLALSCLSCFVITSLTIVPIVVPMVIIDDLNTGLMLASCCSSVMMFFAGFYTGKALGSNPLKFGLMMTCVAWAITIIATFTGG